MTGVSRSGPGQPRSRPIQDINELAAHLSWLASDYGDRDDRRAYFAALYALMTATVAADVEQGLFDDGPRMERFACNFAARYLAASEAIAAGGAAPSCWVVASDAAGHWRPIILQHLLLGMNAHINFDLAITAASIGADDGMDAVHGDFLAINTVLARLLEDVQRRLGSVSPWMGLVDLAGGRKDETIANFSMSRARDEAWREAERLVGLHGEARAAAERALDRKVAKLARSLARPGPLFAGAALVVRLRERAAVADVVAAFARVPLLRTPRTRL